MFPFARARFLYIYFKRSIFKPLSELETIYITMVSEVILVHFVQTLVHFVQENKNKRYILCKLNGTFCANPGTFVIYVLLFM